MPPRPTASAHPVFTRHLPMETVAHLVAVSQGRAAADAYLRGGRIVNVFSGEVLEMNVALAEGLVAYVGTSEAMVGDETEIINAHGFHLVPGYVNAHSHPWMGHNPLEFARAVLPHGTTTTVSDTLMLVMFLRDHDTAAVVEIMEQMARLPMKYFWVARAAPQSRLEDEGAFFSTERVSQLLELDCVVGVAELTRWKRITEGDPALLEAISEALRRGKAVDGHTAGASYERLNGIAAAGVNSCHEPITAEEALHRLRLGLWTMLRHSCLRPDLPELSRVLTEHHADTSRLILTSDGPDPVYVADEGDIDHVIRTAITCGIEPVTAYKMATINPATLYGLDTRLGAIAPGRYADLLFLEDLRNPTPVRVMLNGRIAVQDGGTCVETPGPSWRAAAAWRDAARRWRPTAALFNLADAAVAHPAGSHEGTAATATVRLPVLHLVSAAITRLLDMEVRLADGDIDRRAHPDLLAIGLVERSGNWITKSAIKGFADQLGGMACSLGCATHPVVIGSSAADMALALERLLAFSGGLVLVEEGEVLFASPLELFGVMTDRPFATVAEEFRRFRDLMQARGYRYQSLFYTMQFIACDFLPEVRVTSAGVISVRTGQVLKPVQRLAAHAAS